MNNFNSKSIKFKIRVVPIISILLAIIAITLSLILITKQAILDQLKEDGLMVAEQAVSQIEISDSALDIMNLNIESNIKNLGNFIESNDKVISNEYLQKIAKQFEVDEINIGNSEGKIIYSNLPSSIGTIYEEDHKASIVLKGGENEYIEDIRKSTETNDYYKYGYIKRSNGGVIQIGILANKIQSFSDSVGYQALVSNIGEDPDIVYALFIDKDLNAAAHSEKDRIGIKLEDEGSKKAVLEGQVYTSEYFYDKEGVNVYDIIVPVMHGDDIIGAIDIGLSLKNVEDTIQTIILIISAIGIVSFIIILVLLTLISNSVIKPLNKLSISSKSVANGELYHSIEVKSKDEIGVLALSFRDMVNNLKEIISNIQGKTIETDEMAEQLSSASNQLSSASSEISYAIQEVASGVTSQANDVLEITNYMSALAEEIEGIHKKMDIVKLNVDAAENKANIGKENIDNILISFSNLSKGFNAVNEKVNILSASISQIGNITEVINGISDQTNLLALNAAIEAARAGETGKGFAVVAEEVRKLAQESRNSTEQIKTLVNSITSETEEVTKTSQEVEVLIGSQVKAVEYTTDSFKEIIGAFSNITPLIDDTYDYIDRTLTSKNIVVDKIYGVSTVSQEVSASTEQIAAATEEMMASAQEVSAYASKLRDTSEELTNGVNKFKVNK
jgi:methyl-accepting chemotaxis protein